MSEVEGRVKVPSDDVAARIAERIAGVAKEYRINWLLDRNGKPFIEEIVREELQRKELPKPNLPEVKAGQLWKPPYSELARLVVEWDREDGIVILVSDPRTKPFVFEGNSRQTTYVALAQTFHSKNWTCLGMFEDIIKNEKPPRTQICSTCLHRIGSACTVRGDGFLPVHNCSLWSSSEIPANSK